MKIQPYLFFDGRCDEALAFYKAALGAEVSQVSRFKDAPEGMRDPAIPGERVMHATFTVGDSTIMVSDGHCGGKMTFQGFSLSLVVQDEATVNRFFDALATGGKVDMPLGKTFFSPCFGMLTDRFGIAWMLAAA